MFSTYSLVGFVGYTETGKDTAGLCLRERGWQPLALADPIRESALAIDPWIFVTASELEELRKELAGHWLRVELTGGGVIRLRKLIELVGWRRAKDCVLEARILLQKLGTEAGRDIHGDDCWIEIADRRVDRFDKCYVTDVRFLDEARWLVKEERGLLLLIQREGYGPVNGHRSEQQSWLEKIPHRVIDNNGTKEELWEKVRKAVSLN